MKTWIYSWVIYPFVYSLARVFGLFNKKVRDTLELRSWKDFLSLRYNAGQAIEYWVHVASAGELEYAIPILEELGKRNKRVLVTYYSISAKEQVERLPTQMPHVSLVVPLPHDGLGLMHEFVALARKQGVRFLLLLKYELWPGLLWECNRQSIKVVLVDALEPSWFHRKLLHKLDGILAGYESEVQSILHPNVKVVGDTRVERVLKRLAKAGTKIDSDAGEKLKLLAASKPILVCGSMWPADSRLVLDALEQHAQMHSPFHLIWVPHELDQKEAQQMAESLLKQGYKVVDWDALAQHQELADHPTAILVVKKGLLVELYNYGHAAYVGGGFTDGVHSVWEPALTGMPVACGPKTERSPESKALEKCNRLSEVKTSKELKVWFEQKLLHPLSALAKNNSLSQDVEISKHLGAAGRIIDVCENEMRVS